MPHRFKQKAKEFIADAVVKVLPSQNTQLDQVAISNQYKLMKKLLTPDEMPAFKDVGFRVYSQFEEDGILLYLFSIIGTTNKRVVEICAGDGSECMASNLIINHGWYGLLFDGNNQNVEKGNQFFASHKSIFLLPPVFKHAWITKDNIDSLIKDSGFGGEVDLLSMDIDGNDYYIMEAIQCIKPRVIICETHNVIPGNLSLTIPYRDDFNYLDGKQHIDFRSVSLLAMTKLLNKKGYRLIGAHRFGFNAIYLLNELGTEYFPEVSVESVLNNDFTRFRRNTTWNEVKDMPWVEV